MAALVLLGAVACGGKLAAVDGGQTGTCADPTGVTIPCVPPRDPNDPGDPDPNPSKPRPFPSYPGYPGSSSTSSSSSGYDDPPAPVVHPPTKPPYYPEYDGGTRPPDPYPYPYPVYDAGAPPPPRPPIDLPSRSWNKFPFDTFDDKTSDCVGGGRYVNGTPTREGLWVGVELCSSTRYKIYLGGGPLETFYPVADSAGGGEDHCELVNPKLKLASGDGFEGSNCPSCAIGFTWDHPTGSLVYTRGYEGEKFVLEKWPEYNHYTSTWYECGVSIP